jgi:uncharacterized membrane protein YozB (DUF420 family)
MLFLLNTAIFALTLISPFVALYAVSFIKKGMIQKHQKIQKILFWTCLIALLLLETQIRLSGGSGSLMKNSPYYGTSLLKITLIVHIVGAVLTYIIWAITLFVTNRKFKNPTEFHAKFSKNHRILGKITVIGLFYTALSSIPVYLMTFVL